MYQQRTSLVEKSLNIFLLIILLVVEIESEDKNVSRVPESGNDYFDGPFFQPMPFIHKKFPPVKHNKTTSSKPCACPRKGKSFNVEC